MSILSAADYELVRKSISLDLDATTLPDDVIALDIYSGAAEREVISIDAQAESRTGENEQRVRTATALFTAARLVPSLPSLGYTSESLGDYSYSRKHAIEPSDLIARLRAQAMQELAGVLQTDGTTPNRRRPLAFTTVAGGRGRH